MTVMDAIVTACDTGVAADIRGCAATPSRSLLDSDVYTPMDVFYQPRYFNIPLFQRPYVWTEEAQWQPLWHDVRRMAELRIEAPYQQARHFLGAIVLQKNDGAFDT
jgi:uncharacterized protein with ParB-like and HNH nuclease domain